MYQNKQKQKQKEPKKLFSHVGHLPMAETLKKIKVRWEEV